MEALSCAHAVDAVNSSEQRLYIARRKAEIVEDRRLLLQRGNTFPTESTTSRDFPGASVLKTRRNRGLDGHGLTRRQQSSVDKACVLELEHSKMTSKNPFEMRQERRFLRDVSYPLPVDLTELHRQNLRTLLACRIFGRAVCSPELEYNVPRRVLEIGCGTAYWSAMCHDYFSSLGHKNVAFTGLDIAPLAPDLSEQGVDWTFVQHDLRLRHLPFDDEEFDLIMCKDISLALMPSQGHSRLLEECARILCDGGTIEVWDSDHVIRALSPRSDPAPSSTHSEHELCRKTGGVITDAKTKFIPVKNKHIEQFNGWMTQALRRRGLSATPCTEIGHDLFRDTRLTDISSRRMAIPLSELRWKQHESMWTDPADSVIQVGKERVGESKSDQAAIRQTALLTFVQSVEALESMLCEVNGKNSNEWGHWLSSMMSELLDPSNAALSNGECLELNAWWATKLESPEKAVPKARSSAFIVSLLEGTVPL